MKVFTPIFLSLFLCQAVVSSFVYSQGLQKKSPEQDQAIVKLNADLVTVDVEAMNKKTSSIIGTLVKDDFILYEDKVRQFISYFSQDKLPLSVALLLDASSSVRSYIKEIQQGALEALQYLKPEDEVAVLAFARRMAVMQGFTKDRKAVIDKIEEIGNSNGKIDIGEGTLLNEAIYESARYFKNASQPISRRVVIAITDNLTNGKGRSPKEALNELFESGVVANGIIINAPLAKAGRVLSYNPSVLLIRWALQSGSIHKYANETGGIIVGAKTDEFDTKLIAMIERLRTRYTIGYVSSNTKQDGKFRKIQLQVSTDVERREGKLVVLTKKGYYARKEQNATANLRDK